MKTIRCYVDGSYSPKSIDESLSGWGVLFEDGTELSGTIKHKGTRQIAGECQAVLEAVNVFLESREHEQKLVIFYDYQGLEEWATGKWKAKTDITQIYRSTMMGMMENFDVKFVKVDAAQNRADALATAAIGIQSVH